MDSLDQEKLKQSIMVAEMYYQHNLSQVEIAEQMGVSRPTVSRLLQYAKDVGVVKIQVVNPIYTTENLSKQLSEKYHADVHVVPENLSEPNFWHTYGRYAANVLTSIVKPGDIIGIGWGKTVHHLTEQLEEQSVSGIQVVQLKGSVSYSNKKTYAYESINELAGAYRVNPEYLPLPVIFDNQITKTMVEQDRHIRHVLDLGKKANVALFTVGTVRPQALVFQLGYFNEEEKQELQQTAVGDICSRFIDEQGHIVNDKINQRTIGIDLDDLAQKDHTILLAAGNHKVAGVDAVLKAGYANCAVLDQSLAQLLVDY